MARAIDGDALYQEFEAMAWYDNADRDLAEDMLLRMPTFTPPNEPLTLEQLREMDGVNALWVHNLAFGLHKPRFMLVKNVSEDWWTCCDFDGFKTFCAADYGERYLLYRRPPEVSP